ncbi:MAG TPA: hypothetical protein VIL32_04790 [Steroidobacteraceae bacterium]
MFRNHRGTTLYELLLVLSLLGVFASLAAPALRSTLDALTVRAAREAAFALFARARVLALQHGGAQIELHAATDRLLVKTPADSIVHELDLRPQHVDLVLEGSDPVVLRYDAYGLGRMMSRTITLQAGSRQAGLTISTFGRLRRW